MMSQQNGSVIISISRHELIDLLYSLNGKTAISAKGLPTIASGARLVGMRDDIFSDSILLKFEGPELPLHPPGFPIERAQIKWQFAPIDTSGFNAIVQHERNMAVARKLADQPQTVEARDQ